MVSTSALVRQPERRQPRRLRKENLRTATPRPFIKWVGGKTQLLERIIPQLPEQFGSYHEPFTGGGAVFFALRRHGLLEGSRAYLSDVNEELVATYTSLRDEVELVIEALGRHVYDEDYYYSVRSTDPWALSSSERAARMIYLNRCGFNGLYRVNRSGQFNVPFGRYTNPMICDEHNLRAVSAGLRRVSIDSRSFDTVTRRARRGDLVYFDPPYVPMSRTSNFTSYAKNGFGEEEQERLAQVVEKLTDKGVHVVLSNSDTPWVRQRYERFDVHRVSARRNINSRGERRGPVGEVIVVNQA